LFIFGTFLHGISDAYFREVTNMTKKLLLAAGSILLLSGTVALQGCYDSDPGYGYGGGYGRGYYSGSEPYYGGGYGRDYDEHPNYWANHEAREERHEAHEAEERAERHADHEAREARHHGDHDND
jgi:hypothetical protein